MWFFLALGSAVLVSCTMLLQKKVLFQARTAEISFLLALTYAVISVPLFLVADFSSVDGFTVLMIFVATLPGAGALFLAAKSLKHSQVSETSPFFALSPLIAAVLAFLFLNEKLSVIDFYGMLLMVAGLFILEAKNAKLSLGIFEKGRKKYLLITVASLILFGICSVFDRLIIYSYGVDPLTYLAIGHVIEAVNFGIIYAVSSSPKKDLVRHAKQFWKIVLLIAVLTYLQRYLYASALSIAASLGLVVAVKRLSSFFSVVVGGKLFNEKEIFRKASAAVVIIAGAYLLF